MHSMDLMTDLPLDETISIALLAGWLVFSFGEDDGISPKGWRRAMIDIDFFPLQAIVLVLVLGARRHSSVAGLEQ